MLKFELNLDVTTPEVSAVELISNHCQLSKGEIKDAINKGVLWLTRNKKTKRLRKVKHALKLDDVLHFYYDENVLKQSVAPAQLIEDFGDYSIWYKPYGMLCQGSKYGDHCTINRFIESDKGLNRTSFIIHRLDKAATGIIIIGHSKLAARKLAHMFEHKALNKTYQIITRENNALATKFICNNEVDNKAATSHFNLLKHDTFSGLCLYQVSIETGRKHQIRKHASENGIPVIGDRLHGLKEDNLAEHVDLQLCAVQLSFACPITEQFREIKLPKHLRPNLAHVVAIYNQLSTD